VHWGVQLFVLFHVLAVVVWTLPAPNPQKTGQQLYEFNQQNLKPLPPIESYMISVGVGQAWDMFAPDPFALNIYMDAVVLYQDGETEVYEYPRMEKLGPLEKYAKERYRKYYEYVWQDSQAAKWPYIAQGIAHQMADDPENPPVQVTLRRYWKPIAGPGEPQPQAYRSHTFYLHPVDLEELYAEKGWPGA
jgi:hypothetical protein